jgi:D-3-phosphoglycerate dehydrogenase / 2-oxoglutarate reductase
MDDKPLVVITDRFDHHLLLQMKSDRDIRFVYLRDLFSEPDLLQQARGLILRSSHKVDSGFLKHFPSLEIVVTATSGFDHLDLVALQAKNIVSCHVPQAQVQAAAELTLLHILSAQRRWSQAVEQVKQGVWQRERLLGRELSQLQLGIIGMGRVGSRVAEMAHALGLTVCAYDPFITEHDPRYTMLGFEELMRSSDMVSLHVPLTARTRQMIQASTLQWMAPDAALINMSRGEVVNESDLIQHLQTHPQFFAGLDVYQKEPLSPQSPLLDLNNVHLSPHIGASTQEAIRKASEGAVAKIHSFFAGEALGEDLLPPQAPWFEG